MDEGGLLLSSYALTNIFLWRMRGGSLLNEGRGLNNEDE